MTLKPMRDFDPSQPAIVHDRLDGRTFEWSPEWFDEYHDYATEHGPGVMEFDGALLDGWMEVGAMRSQESGHRIAA
jgi:hypothetical protein